MTTPQPWECPIYRQVLKTLEEGGRTDSSHYVLTEEAVRLCDREKDHE